MEMLNLQTSVSEVEDLHNRFMAYVNADERSEAITKMYDAFGDELFLAPASSRSYYHNCKASGYIDHVVRVADIALEMSAFYKKHGGKIDFTKQELIFSALHHDLGKLGNPGQPYYINQDSDWHRKRGEYYKHNETINYMKVSDRAIMTLQCFNITVTEKEYLAIKLADGLYNEANKPYLMNYSPYPIDTNLHHIIHWADHMAARIESDIYRL